MMRSLYAGISGLRNHQTRMDVIGNNIANVNTIGFKGSRVNFQDMLSQTMQGASGASGERGGTNPIQIGMGMGVASIDTIFTDGSFQSTGKQTDLAISGQGFFVLSDGSNQLYTRAGGFDFDTNGNLLVPGTGYKVMGYKADPKGAIDANQPLQSIQIPVGYSMAANTTSKVTYANNLMASAATGISSDALASIPVFDSQGNAYTLDGTFEKTGNNAWSFTPATTIQNAAGTTIATIPPTTIAITFNPDGSFLASTPVAATINLTPTGPYAGAAVFSITPDFSTMTQYGGATSVQATGQDGYASGSLEKTSINTSGIIVGQFSNGQILNLAQVALATFNNPSGLGKSGESLYVKTTNSGEPQVGGAGTGGRGSFNAGSLEMSNVDLAQQFSDMIVTQRGFQANSKIITTTDSMLEELVNLKR